MNDQASLPALQRLRERIRAADAECRPLRIRGSGSKDFYGGVLSGEPLDTREYRGITSYEPTELVLTARCGTPLEDIKAALAEHKQWLPFEPPAFGPGATIGGVVAAGLSGPGRASAGAVRDYVLGAALVDAQGRALNFGGQVMKNVAGYDVSRLLCGSLGILGLIAEVSLKVLPRPAASATVRMPMQTGEALRRLNEWGGSPLPITASAWLTGRLTLRLSGARAAVDAALAGFLRDFRAEQLDEDAASGFWTALREHRLPFFSGAGGRNGRDDGVHSRSGRRADEAGAPERVPPSGNALVERAETEAFVDALSDEPEAVPLWRLSLPSIAAPVDLPGVELIEWGGALRWWRSEAEPDAVRAVATRVGGHATLFRGGDRRSGVFTPLAPPLLTLHRRLKAEFDPNGIFNPGRLIPGL